MPRANSRDYKNVGVTLKKTEAARVQHAAKACGMTVGAVIREYLLEHFVPTIEKDIAHKFARPTVYCSEKGEWLECGIDPTTCPGCGADITYE